MGCGGGVGMTCFLRPPRTRGSSHVNAQRSARHGRGTRIDANTRANLVWGCFPRRAALRIIGPRRWPTRVKRDRNGGVLALKGDRDKVATASGDDGQA
jgi:hypothetical protein